MALFADKNFFGLDIGSSSIRLVQLRAGGGKPELATFGSIAMPAGLFQSDSALDRQNVAGIIKQLLQKTKVGVNVVAGLPGSQIYTAVIKVPKISSSELAQAIRWQVEKHVPLGLNEVKVDWNVLPSAESDKEQDVLLVAAPLSMVDKYAQIFDMAGLELAALEINPIAVARSSVAATAEPTIVVDIGALNTDIAMVIDNVVRLVRTTRVGGEAFTRAVSKVLSLDPVQADQFKQKFGMLQDKLEGQVYNALKTVLDEIVEEIDRAREYYAAQHNVEFKQVVLSGGSARMPELPLYLATALNAEVQLANPWAQVSYNPSIGPTLAPIALEYSTAVGLALRGMK